MNISADRFPCGRLAVPLTRRQMLMRCANGFGGIALLALLGDKAFGALASAEPN